jgi:hypothetical protein
MADFITVQRQGVRHKLLTKRGRTQEAYMQTSRALMREMVRLQREIQVDVQVIASAAVSRSEPLGEAVEWESADGLYRTTDKKIAANWAGGVGVNVVRRAHGVPGTLNDQGEKR